MSLKTTLGEVEPYITKDGSEIRELLHPSQHAVRQQSLAEATIDAARRPLVTLSARVAPPQHRVSSFGPSSLQSYIDQSVSSGESTTQTRSIRGQATKAASAWKISGRPSRLKYCLGFSAPKREPLPAAGTIAKYRGMA